MAPVVAVVVQASLVIAIQRRARVARVAILGMAATADYLVLLAATELMRLPVLVAQVAAVPALILAEMGGMAVLVVVALVF